MSLGEKIYLAMVVSMFVMFMVLLATLSWLDAKDARLERRRQRALQTEHKPGTFIAGGATAHH